MTSTALFAGNSVTSSMMRVSKIDSTGANRDIRYKDLEEIGSLERVFNTRIKP